MMEKYKKRLRDIEERMNEPNNVSNQSSEKILH